MYEEVSDDPQTLIDIIHRAVERIRKRGDLSADNIKYFMVEDHKFAHFYLLPKSTRDQRMFQDDLLFQAANSIHRKHFSFSRTPFATSSTSYIKDTNDFLK